MIAECLTQKSLCDGAGGVLKDVLRRGSFDDLTLVENSYGICYVVCEAHFVSDEDAVLVFSKKRRDGVENFGRHFRVECRSRFIEKKKGWLMCECSSDCDALALTS
mgnify:CR=1 FL=1